MKHTVQIIYPNFSEIFDVKIDENNLELDLKSVNKSKVEDNDKIINLDLSSSVRDNYSNFPLENGDLTLIQVGNTFVVSCHQGEQIHWLRFNNTQILLYLTHENILEEILPFIDEDRHLFLNSILADFCRNDFSYSDLNKKVKYAKISIIMHFISKHLPLDYRRIILDETILGDVEVYNIPMAFRFSQMKFVDLIKINNTSKIIVALEKAGILDSKFRFQADSHFYNNVNASADFHIVFGQSGMQMDYKVERYKNYVFDLGDKEYPVNFGNQFTQQIRGKLCVFGGDERDLMIN